MVEDLCHGFLRGSLLLAVAAAEDEEDDVDEDSGSVLERRTEGMRDARKDLLDVMLGEMTVRQQLAASSQRYMQQKMLRMEAQSGEAKRSRQRRRRQTRQAGRSCKICMSSDSTCTLWLRVRSRQDSPCACFALQTRPASRNSQAAIRTVLPVWS